MSSICIVMIIELIEFSDVGIRECDVIGRVKLFCFNGKLGMFKIFKIVVFYLGLWRIF